MSTPHNPALAALLDAGRRVLAQHRTTTLRKPAPKDTPVSHADEPADPIPAPDAPHRIPFVTTASTTVTVPNTGQSREEATEQAWEEVYVSLCHQCAREVDLGEFEPEEQSAPIGPDGDTGTRAIVEPAPPALELTRGAWLRNHLGAEVFVVEPARTALAPDLWTVDTCGVGVELATAEGLAACGYTLVTEAAVDGE